jgi:hypothetical protein
MDGREGGECSERSSHPSQIVGEVHLLGCVYCKISLMNEEAARVILLLGGAMYPCLMIS